jgi:hypothetical protein
VRTNLSIKNLITVKTEYLVIGAWDGFVFQNVCRLYHELKLYQ